MLNFILGLILGGALGIFFMALFQINYNKEKTNDIK